MCMVTRFFGRKKKSHHFFFFLYWCMSRAVTILFFYTMMILMKFTQFSCQLRDIPKNSKPGVLIQKGLSAFFVSFDFSFICLFSIRNNNSVVHIYILIGFSWILQLC